MVAISPSSQPAPQRASCFGCILATPCARDVPRLLAGFADAVENDQVVVVPFGLQKFYGELDVLLRDAYQRGTTVEDLLERLELLYYQSR